jgi:hypothetical protein
VADRRVIVGVEWADGLPSVRVRYNDHIASGLVPLLGLQLNHRAAADSPRVCLGHRPFRSGGPSYVDCVQRPQPGSRNCRSCAVIEATFASNLHHAHTKEDVGVDPTMAAHLRQPNLLYLAAFRDGSMKVGTSTERRLDTRLAEQGAWLARVVAWVPDGITVRLLEDHVTERLGLTQAVSANRKLKGLLQPQPDHQLTAELDGHRDDIHRLIVDSDTIEPMDDAWQHPRSDKGDWSQLHRYPGDLATGAHDLVVTNACGRLVLVNRPGGDDRFVADLQKIYGLQTEIGDFGSQPLAVQDSLF